MTLHRLAALLSAVPLAVTMAHTAHAGQHAHTGGGGHVGGMHGAHAQIAPGHADRGHFDHGQFHGGAGAFPHRNGFAHRDGFRHDGFRQDSRFIHGFHGGRVGWWSVTGGVWYPWYADTVPVYPAPEPVEAAPTAWYFFCPSAGTYYPYVTYCPVAWQAIPATSASY